MKSLCVKLSIEHATSSHHSTETPVNTMLTYPWKCTVLHCNHLGNTWKPLVLMTRHFDYCPITSEGDNQSVGSSAPVVSRCFPGGYNLKLYISRGRLAWWLLTFLHSVIKTDISSTMAPSVADLIPPSVRRFVSMNFLFLDHFSSNGASKISAIKQIFILSKDLGF